MPGFKQPVGQALATASQAGLMSAADKVLVNLLNSGSGTPEGVVTATVGDVYMDTTNGKLYLKVSGTGNTGWREVSPSMSGTWTPAGTILSNLDTLTPGVGFYARVADVVVGGVPVTVDPTAASSIQYALALPVTSNFTGGNDAVGVVYNAGSVGRVASDFTNDRLDVFCANTGTVATTNMVLFAYRVMP